MFWQIIQYFFLVAGDILVSVTALIFAYAEAPKRYKVVISSIWVMTSGVGDLIVIIVAHSRLATTQVNNENIETNSTDRFSLDRRVLVLRGVYGFYNVYFWYFSTAFR